MHQWDEIVICKDMKFCHSKFLPWNYSPPAFSSFAIHTSVRSCSLTLEVALAFFPDVCSLSDPLASPLAQLWTVNTPAGPGRVRFANRSDDSESEEQAGELDRTLDAALCFEAGNTEVEFEACEMERSSTAASCSPSSSSFTVFNSSNLAESTPSGRRDILTFSEVWAERTFVQLFAQNQIEKRTTTHKKATVHHIKSR